MQRAIVLATILLCGCASPPVRQYSSGQADHVRDVMYQCAVLISQMSIIFDDAESNWHYQQCIFQNGATI